MLYKVGDVILIRKDLLEDEHYFMEDETHSDTVCYEMMEYLGETARIVSLRRGGLGYSLDIDAGRWCWTDDMFNRRVTTDLSLSPFQSWEKQNAI